MALISPELWGGRRFGEFVRWRSYRRPCRRVVRSSDGGLDGLTRIRLTLTNDRAYDLVIQVAAGGLDDVSLIAAELESHAAPWRA